MSQKLYMSANKVVLWNNGYVMKFWEGYRNLHENSFNAHKRNLRFALMK